MLDFTSLVVADSFQLLPVRQRDGVSEYLRDSNAQIPLQLGFASTSESKDGIR